MFKNTILAILIIAAFFIVGCEDSEGESRLQNQQSIDHGDYDSVIANLESKEYKDDDDYLALGAAYMGSSGLAFSDVIVLMSESSEDSASGDSFSSFIENVGTDDNPEAIYNLQKARDSYSHVVTPSSCEENAATLSDTQKDVCLFSGLTDSMKAAIVINYLGGDAALREAAHGGDDDHLTASSCALQYAYDGTKERECSYIVDRRTITFGSPDSYLPLSVVVNADATQNNGTGASESESNYIPDGVIVNGNVEDGNTVEYDYKNAYIPLRVVVNGNSFDYLMTTTRTIKQIIITDGYCYANFSECSKDTTDCFACPLQMKGEDELLVANLLVDAFNGGFDSVIGAIGNNEDIAQDIIEYRNEITRYQNRDITLEDIIIYLNKL